MAATSASESVEAREARDLADEGGVDVHGRA